MIKLSKAKSRKLGGFAYLGATKQSAKMRYSYAHNVETYCIYLAPADMSGHNVCPNNQFCKELCLNGAGHNKCDIISRGAEHSKINQSRIKKTKLFFENRQLFMDILVDELISAKKHAERNGLDFAVRLNGTSDLSLELFKLRDGRNILEAFPDVQFYDYTKVTKRLPLQKKYANYDLTLSYNGHNWDDCRAYLNDGGKVAVVFENELPKLFHGYVVNDGNGYDMRYLDNVGEIVGLHFHRVGGQYKEGVYERPETKFIVREEDHNCTWNFNK